MVLTRRYSCGNTGLQWFCGSRGRKFGLMLPPPLSWVRSVSIPSSSSTTVPMVPGQVPAVMPMIGFEVVMGESLRFQVTSYQKPVVIGEPPVTNAANPGYESEGCDVDALV